MDFIEEIYEAAAVPELWSGQGVLDKLAKYGGCRDGIIFSVDPNGGIRWVSNDAAHEKTSAYIAGNWVAKNPYLATPERIKKFNEPRFLLDTEVMSAEEMARSDYYQNFMKPFGCYWHAGTSILSPSGDVIKFSVHRSFDDGPLHEDTALKLTEFRPHLARASLIAARLRFEQVRTTLEALDRIGFRAAAVKNGKLVQASKGFEQLVPAVVQDRIDRIIFTETSANTLWQKLLNTDILRLGGSFPIKATEDFATLIVHVLPITGAANDVFGSADMLLAIAEASGKLDIDDTVLMGLYDLTPAESQIAKDIAMGQDVASIAKARQVSVGTVRAQLHSVFEKTGVQRQAELARVILTLTR